MPRLLMLVMVAVLAVGLAACGDDETLGDDPVTATGPATAVQVADLRADMDAYADRVVRTTGTVTEIVPGESDLRAFFLDGVLVVAPAGEVDPATGDRLTVEGTVHDVVAEEQGVVEGDNAGDTFLADHDGDPALFATTVTPG